MWIEQLSHQLMPVKTRLVARGFHPLKISSVRWNFGFDREGSPKFGTDSFGRFSSETHAGGPIYVRVGLMWP